MKKAKPYIRSVCFLLGLLVLIAACDYVFSQSGYIRCILYEVNRKDNDYDTIVLGASHCRSAIDPQKLDDVLGTNTLNIGIPGETIKDSYYLLMEACRTNHVKRVILDVDYQYWIAPQVEGYFQETFIYNQISWTSPVKWKYMWDNKKLLDIRNAVTKRGVYNCSPSKVIENVKFKNTDTYKNYDIYTTNVPDANGPYVGKGFFYRETSDGNLVGREYVETFIGREQNGLAPLPLLFFDQIVHYCNENNIELICVTSPITPSVMEMLNMGYVHELLQNLFQEYGLTYYDFNMARMDVLPREDRDYGDWEGHMIGKLGQEYSAVLAQVLQGHNTKTLNRNDYFYTSFSEMYERMDADYQRAVKGMED